MGIQFNCIINAFWLHMSHNHVHAASVPLSPGGMFDCLSKSNQSLWKACDKFLQYTPHPAPPPPLSHPLCHPSITLTQQTACKLMRISSCNHLHTDWKKQEPKSNHNLLSLFFMIWLAWITVPLAPISFPRMRHTGSIVQLTKWPLNHVILLSVHHWQK